MDGLKEEWTRAPSSSGKHSPSSLRPGFTGSPARRAYDLWKTKSKAGGEVRRWGCWEPNGGGGWVEPEPRKS